MCTENISSFIPDFWISSIIRRPFQSILMSTVQPIIGILGFLLNSSFVYMVWRSKKMHTNTNMYLVNLAISDSAFLVYNTWYSLTAYTATPFVSNETFLRGDFGCVLYRFINYGSYYTSLWLVALVTLERYLAICHPFTHRSIDTRKRTNKCICLCWLLGAVCGGLMATFYTKFREGCYSYSSKYKHLPTTIALCGVRRGVWAKYERYQFHITPLVETTTFLIVLIGKSQQKFRTEIQYTPVLNVTTLFKLSNQSRAIN